MLIRVPLLIGGLLGLATSALADAGVPPVPTDFQPAVSTQYRPPDGGRRYPKPDTKLLISPQAQQRMQGFQSELNDNPLPASAGSGLVNPAPRRQPRMKDPLALPPPSSSPSSSGGSFDPLTAKPADQPGR